MTIIKNKILFNTIAALALSMTCIINSIADPKTPHPPQTITINEKGSITKLHYTGTLNPIRLVPLLSPVDGTITERLFEYGSSINKGQILFNLDSSSLEQQYRDAIKSFLSAKQSTGQANETYNTNKLLYKAGALAKQSLDESQIQMENSRISYIQAKLALDKILDKTTLNMQQVEKYKLTDTAAVNKLLTQHFRHLSIKANATGIALFPISDGSSSGGDGNKPLQVGSQVKSGGLLLSIGDLSGFSTGVQISEININRIKAGQKVIITGNAFPGIKLNGVVSSVDSQAQQNSSGSGVSEFAIRIKIPNITKLQRKIIHVGMTSNITLPIINPANILIPLNAVAGKNGNNTVAIVQKDGSIKQVNVITGETTVTDVTIIKGLKTGDRIQVPNPDIPKDPDTTTTDS